MTPGARSSELWIGVLAILAALAIGAGTVWLDLDPGLAATLAAVVAGVAGLYGVGRAAVKRASSRDPLSRGEAPGGTLPDLLRTIGPIVSSISGMRSSPPPAPPPSPHPAPDRDHEGNR